MSDRPTPETDAVAEAVGMGHFMVDSDFARKLERERDELCRQARKIRGERNAIKTENARLRKVLAEMRDMIRAMNFGDNFPKIVRTLKSADDILSNPMMSHEADEARDALRTLAEHGEIEIQRVTKERDEARAELRLNSLGTIHPNIPVTTYYLLENETK